MNSEPLTPPSARPLRLTPGIVIVLLQWIAWLGVPLVAPDLAMYGIIGGVMGGGVATLLWWLFASRAPWTERVGVLAFILAVLAVATRVVHPSIANGMMGMMLRVYSVPFVCLALVAGAVATRGFSAGARRAAIAAGIVLAFAAFTLVRTGGVRGEGGAEWHWRWTPDAEQRLLARTEPEAPVLAATPVGPVTSTAPSAVTPEARTEAAAPAAPKASAPARPALTTADVAARPPVRTEPPPVAALATSVWPGFRGPHRDGVVPGVRIDTDWAKTPPHEIWRRPVGPGWSSFAVAGDRLYTQEQRGEDEIVSCYRLGNGEPVWRHRDPARFWESNAGAGPRGTPCLGGGRVYAFGATGILNALDAGDGSVVWSRNPPADTGAKMPGWGFTSSPLFIDDSILVAASGRLAAYDAATGAQRWVAETRGGSYSSPHLTRLGGVTQVLLQTGTGVSGVAPADGSTLWRHGWEGVPILQPAQTADGDVLIAAGDMAGGMGTKRLAVARGPSGWSAEERWTSSGLKPYFNDFVVHEGYAFGFDGSILACIGLDDGKRRWKGGRYGHGQLILLPDQDVLLVLSEEGELALVSATPDQFKELARFKAIEGKTWNHPALAGDILLVRNGEEMAAFRLALAR